MALTFLETTIRLWDSVKLQFVTYPGGWNMKTLRIPILVLLAITVFSSGCIVSKKDYLLKEDEAQKCTENLAGQVEDNKALRTELSTCQSRVDELTANLANVSDERDLLENNLTVEQAVNEELKTHNDRLSDLLQKKGINDPVYVNTPLIHIAFKGTLAALRNQTFSNTIVTVNIPDHLRKICLAHN